MNPFLTPSRRLLLASAAATALLSGCGKTETPAPAATEPAAPPLPAPSSRSP